jgi:hypothetical protein
MIGFTHQVLTRTLTIIVWEKYYKSSWNREALWSDRADDGQHVPRERRHYPQRV